MSMMAENTYNRCIQSMFALQRFGIKLGLATIRNILAGLGDPQNGYNCIHVAGTNGKGSVASFLASILYQSGYKTGLYTSPHLVRFNERIQVNNRPISDENVVESYHAVRHAYRRKRELTFFEFSTAMAFHEFSRQKVEWAVIETGMGGRLDATNVIKPRLSIITNVSLEHQEYLGDSLIRIAAEKAGIIKHRTPVITGIRQKKALSVVAQIARRKSAPLFRLGKEFRVRRHRSNGFSYYGMDAVWHRLQTSLMGSHQVDNAALALAACELLNRINVEISPDKIKKGLLQAHWPGRLEVVSSDPYLLLDGAHNLMAARKLANFLTTLPAGRRITLVIGILDDKPYKEMLKSLLPVCRRVILTRAKINRALDPLRLYAVAKDFTPQVTVIADVEKALKCALENVRSKDAVCVAGSLYIVGEAKAAIANGLLKKVKRLESSSSFST
jgi:dihydrofolate synthase / folylpolyglutamate synthase